MNPYNELISIKPSTENRLKVVGSVVRWLREFSQQRYTRPTREQLEVVDASLQRIFKILLVIEDELDERDLLELMSAHANLHALVGMSSVGNADHFLHAFFRNSRLSPVGFLFYGARSALDIPADPLFDHSPAIGSEWYGQFFYGVRTFIDKDVQENLRRQLRLWPKRLLLRPSVSNGYMRSTYIDYSLDRLWKSRFNALCKTAMRVKIRNTPDHRKIAVVTARWSPVNPTYKNRYALFENMARSFDLTLFHVGPDRTDLETGIFKEVHKIAFQKDGLKLGKMVDNQFGAVFYPDIGMNIESRFVSNLRFAPVQLTTNSHPVSTFNSEIDYFISGEQSEESTTGQNHYSEKLLLMSGIGTKSSIPAQVTRNVRPQIFETNVILIGCPWGCLKANHSLLTKLKKIQDKTRRKIRYRFLFTVGNDGGYAFATIKDIERILGHADFDFIHDQPYENYQKLLAQCDLALDAYPFGGNTSIIDCLAVGLPIVVQDGWQFYNKAGPAILRHVGLADLVAHSDYEYVEKASYYLEDNNALLAITERAAKVDASSIEKAFSKDDDLTSLMKELLPNHSKTKKTKR